MMPRQAAAEHQMLPLVERDGHLAELMAAVGSGRVMLVVGEAGIGKTSLMRAFAHRVGASTRIWWGGCDPLSTPLPLGPLQDMAASQPDSTLAALLARGERRDALFSAFLDYLRRPGAIAIIEDAHWADDATLDLLRFVGRRIERTRGLLVVTYRSDEIAPTHPLCLALGELPRASTTRLHLPPLSEEAVSTLARRAGRSPVGLYATAGGNPFFVTEILADIEGGVPVTVRDAVLARAARLSPGARAVLELASVSPRHIERWLVEVVASPAPGAVDECLATGMLEEERGLLAFRHELARLALRDSLQPVRASSLHGQVLRVLEARAGTSPGRLAHHAAGAGEGEAVLRYAPQAAREAERLGAHREAAAHYAAALAWAVDLSPVERAELLERRSFECYLTDQIAEAIEARRDALEIWRAVGNSPRAGDAHRWMSRLHWFQGERAQAERYAEEAVAILEGIPGRGPALAMAYSTRAQLAMLAHRTAEALHWGNLAVELAGELNHVETLVHALNNIGAAQLHAGEPAGRLDLERSLRLSLEHAMEEHAARAYTNLACCASSARDYATAIRHLDEGIEYCRDHDLNAWVLYLTAERARLRLDRGEWSAAADDADFVLRHPRVSPVSRIQALIVIGLLRARRGDPGSGSVLDEAERLARLTAESQRIVPVAVARVEAAWIRGAADGVVREWEVAAQCGPAGVRWELAALREWGRRMGRPAAASEDDPPPYRLLAEGDWQGAAAAWDAMGCPYARALALSASRDPAVIRDALRILGDLGAAATAAAISRELRSRGVRGAPRGPRSSTRANPAGLTARQLEVLSLLSQGLKNAEIAIRLELSPRTADHHVSAVLAKLGVDTRARAVIAARRLGLS